MAGNQLPMPGGEQRDQTKFIVFENFEKMNTQSVRQSLSEKQLAWLENLQPISGNNLATVPAPNGVPLASIDAGETISTMFYAALNEVDYLVVFTFAGSGYLINIATGNVNHFAPDGTYSPHPDVTTWQASRLLIADPIAGYGTFDGTIVVGQGGVSPNITVTHGGSGYSTPPSVTISGGSGTGATAHAVVVNGSVTQVILDSPGTGYQAGDVLTVTFGTSPGSGAAAHVTMTGAPVTNLGIVNPGTWVGSPGVGDHQLSFSGGGGSGAGGFAVVSSTGGTGRLVTGVVLTSAGSGYTSPPTVILSTPSVSPSFSSTIGTQSVAGIVLDAGGTGYLAPPSASIVPSDGLGSGAAAITSISGTSVNAISITLTPIASLFVAVQGVSSTPGSFALSFSGSGTGATGTVTIGNYTNSTGGTSVGVIGAFLTAPGTGYGPTTTVSVVGASFSVSPTIQVFTVSQGAGYDLTPAVIIGSGGTDPATAEAHVWPFINSSIAGYQFTTLAVFQGRVWLGGGPLLTWSGTGASFGNVAYDDFLAADASGSLIISDADLIHAITALRSLNNYLFIMGDQSVKQIGNITLGGTDLDQTLFTITTLSSDQGTIYPKSCISYNRVLLFVNQNGVYGVVGSSVQKLSADMDGIFKAVDFTQMPQGALADISAIHNAVFLLKYNDPALGGTARSILIAFDGKQWFVMSQGNSLLAMATSASLSTGAISLYGSSGIDITNLLRRAGLPVSFKIQTSLTHHGDAVQRKRLIAAGFSYNLSGLTVASGTVATGGSGGTPVSAPVITITVVGGTGSAAQFQAALDGSGALIGPLVLTAGGSYSVFPASPAPVTGSGLVGATVNLTQVPSQVIETVEATNQATNITVPVVPGFHSPGGATGVGAAGKFLGMTITGTLARFTMTNMLEEYQEIDLWR